MNRILLARLLLTASLATISTAIQAAAAGPANNSTSASAQGVEELEEVVVTAEKREERINSVPMAVTALGANQLKEQGVTTTSDLARIVPSFSVQNSIYDNPVYYIRGVGFADPASTISPGVSVYVDQIPLPYAVMARGAILDLERLEVLKGPQGTLFGENSTGGAVNYIAAKPTNSLRAGADLSYGRFNSLDADAFVSGPITDTLGVRLAMQGERQGDWQYSTTRDETRGQKQFINGRMILAWKPNDRVNVDLSAQAWHDGSDTQAAQFVLFVPQVPTGNPATLAALSAAKPAPNNDRATDWNPDFPKASDNTFYQTALRVNAALTSSIELTSLTAYSHLSFDQPVQPDGTAYVDGVVQEYTHISSIYQELRLDGDVDRLRWMLGGNYEHDQTSDLLKVLINTTNNDLLGVTYNTTQETNDNPRIHTYAVFGSLDYKLTDTLTARGSIRYTSVADNHQGCLADGGDGKLGQAFGTLSSILSGSPTTILPGACVTLNPTTFRPTGPVDQSLDQNNVSWRVGPDWKLSPQALVYANISKGYKAGGFTSIPAVFSNQLIPVTQESVMAYEAGLKSTLADNRVQFDLSAFYYDYRNKQLQGYVNIPPFGPLPTLVNVPKSTVAGVEAEIGARLTPLLRAQLSGSYLFTRVGSNPINPTAPLGNPASFIGERFPNTPAYQVNVDLEQRIPISDGTEAYVGGDLAYRSDASAAFGRDSTALQRELFKLPSYTLLDLRGGIRFNHGAEGVELWARNVTNAFYLTNVATDADVVGRFTGAPQTFGIRTYWRMQ